MAAEEARACARARARGAPVLLGKRLAALTGVYNPPPRPCVACAARSRAQACACVCKRLCTRDVSMPAA
eukprot:2789543-Pleurochrysis_carterae.AAC.1